MKRLQLFLALIGLLPTPVWGLEEWADQKLPVKEGLGLWLDASSENAARSKDGFLLASGVGLDIWHDASGKKRNVSQPAATCRPKFVQTAEGTHVQFDGIDDFLSASGLNKQLEKVTIFIQAAPQSNKAYWRAFLGINRTSINDYQSGMNVDLGGGGGDKFDTVNVEGCGSGGGKNLLETVFPFGKFHLLTITSQPGDKGVKLFVDGIQQGARGRDCAALGFDQLTLGARFFSNTPEAPYAQGFLEGDIAEVLIYDRILSDEERASVERYLQGKILVQQIAGRKLAPLSLVSNLPPVQMLLPGFSVRELPLTLNNINCLKYRPDGKLVALGYDGNVWLLSDTDGDGLEDKATPFWNKPTMRAPIGMALTPPGYSRGEGVFVPSKGKVSLIVDINKDDIADEEIIVAKGWNELFHGVDALGVAIDRDGSVFFGLGTVNFTDAYLINKTNGKAMYNLQNEHGTILKVSPDFSTREIVCTGIRFPVAMAFNSTGDLFCTDQEGATWLPNGNPLDELLYIEKGKHYGFPPRHPKHLPGVIDEPSVFDYAPQHQSTCGLNFNEPVNGGPIFGPAYWRGSAFVSGYSRGKLWRTQLTKTAQGYVAQNQMIGIINMLPADACVSPQGDLVVAAHSGQPDWGSGPTGTGKLFKISYVDTNAPLPIAVEATSPTETRVLFDRQLNAAQLNELAKRVVVTEGRYVAAGDRFESLRPGYQVVKNQMVEPRYELDIHSVGLGADGKTILIHTAPRARNLGYAVMLPRLGKRETANKMGLPQHDTIDLAYNLTGVETIWQASGTGEKKTWSLPHLNLDVSRAFINSGSGNAELKSVLSKSGKLTLRTQLDLWQMLRAATQPGSKLDFEYPEETVTVVLKSKGAMQVIAPAMKVANVSDKEVHLTAIPKADEWSPIEVTLQTVSGAETSLDVSWFTAEDSRPRALPLRRMLLPWAKPTGAAQEKELDRTIPEIAGGNWLRGKKIFFGDQVGCYKCHVSAGEGGKIGPDLSNLIHRDYASVMKDITEPSAAINPDHVAYSVELNDGEVLSGVPLGGGEVEVLLADASGHINPISKKNIKLMKASTLSLMPEGLLQGLMEQQRKDLFTYLLMPSPLEPAALEIRGEPVGRTQSEIAPLLNASKADSDKCKPMNIILCAGPKDHGPGEHDYPLWQNRWSKLLALADGVSVGTASNWPSAGQFAKADVIIFYSNNPDWTAGRTNEVDSFLKRGGGLVYLHYAVDGHAHCEELAQRIGLAWRGGQSKFRHGALDLKFQTHPITEGFNGAHFVDESYWNLVGSQTNVQLIASGKEENADQPLMWVREQGKGRVFVSIPGHYTWTFDDPLFRLLILRGVAWTAHEPINRFNDLTTIGSRMVVTEH